MGHPTLAASAIALYSGFMHRYTPLVIAILATAVAPAWACGDMSGLAAVLITFVVGAWAISLLPAWLLAYKSKVRGSWGAFLLGALLAPLAGYQILMLPLQGFGFFGGALVMVTAMSATAVAPALFLEWARRRE